MLRRVQEEVLTVVLDQGDPSFQRHNVTDNRIDSRWRFEGAVDTVASVLGGERKV